MLRAEKGRRQEFIDITKRADVGSHRVLDVFLLVLLLHLINYPRHQPLYRNLKQMQRAVWWGKRKGRLLRFKLPHGELKPFYKHKFTASA